MTPAAVGGHQPVIAKGDHQYALKQTENTLEVFVHSGTWIAASAPLPAGWVGREHHVAGVLDHDAKPLTLHVDGAAVAHTATDRVPDSTTAQLALDSWGAQTHDEYKLFADRDHEYTYRLRPLVRRDRAMDLYRRPTSSS